VKIGVAVFLVSSRMFENIGGGGEVGGGGGQRGISGDKHDTFLVRVWSDSLLLKATIRSTDMRS
jgi:hypothetical protein